MITMRSDWWNADSYYPWIDPLVEAAFGAEMDLHWDLYLQTHAHRLQRGPGCEAYPSPPSRAPLWAVLAEQLPSPPEVILETGTGYATVLIAEAFPAHRCSPSSTTPSTGESLRRRSPTPACPAGPPSCRPRKKPRSSTSTCCSSTVPSSSPLACATGAC